MIVLYVLVALVAELFLASLVNLVKEQFLNKRRICKRIGIHTRAGSMEVPVPRELYEVLDKIDTSDTTQRI